MKKSFIKKYHSMNYKHEYKKLERKYCHSRTEINRHYFHWYYLMKKTFLRRHMITRHLEALFIYGKDT